MVQWLTLWTLQQDFLFLILALLLTSDLTFFYLGFLVYTMAGHSDDQWFMSAVTILSSFILAGPETHFHQENMVEVKPGQFRIYALKRTCSVHCCGPGKLEQSCKPEVSFPEGVGTWREANPTGPGSAEHKHPCGHWQDQQNNHIGELRPDCTPVNKQIGFQLSVYIFVYASWCFVVQW